MQSHCECSGEPSRGWGRATGHRERKSVPPPGVHGRQTGLSADGVCGGPASTGQGGWRLFRRCCSEEVWGGSSAEKDKRPFQVDRGSGSVRERMTARF